MRDFRIVVAAHGDLARALVASAEMICGPLEDVQAVDLVPDGLARVVLRAFHGGRRASRPTGSDPDGSRGRHAPQRRPGGDAAACRGAVLISGVNLAVLIEAATSHNRARR